MDNQAIATRLVDHRGRKRREVVAADLGISVSAVAMYERGARIPRDEIKEKMAEYYNTTVGALFFDE